MYPSSISRALCSDGMRCIKPLAPSRNETNSSRVNGGADGAILGICAEGGHDQAGFRFPLWRPAARACRIRVCSTTRVKMARVFATAGFSACCGRSGSLDQRDGSHVVHRAPRRPSRKVPHTVRVRQYLILVASIFLGLGDNLLKSKPVVVAVFSRVKPNYMQIQFGTRSTIQEPRFAGTPRNQQGANRAGI